MMVYRTGGRARCVPRPAAGALAQVLVQAGGDVVVGTHAHVLLGGGYLGSAYVDYGLGYFAFYDNSPAENASGSLVIRATGRHIDQVTSRPAMIVDDLPQPLSGDAATAALGGADPARACTNVSLTPGAPVASGQTESAPAPAAAVQKLSADCGRARVAAPPAERDGPDERVDRGGDADSGSDRDIPCERRRPVLVRTGAQPRWDPDLRALSRLHRGRLRLRARRSTRWPPTGEWSRWTGGTRDSTKTGHLDGYTIEQLAADLAACLKTISKGPVDLLDTPWVAGSSWAPVVAQPEFVRSLILMDTGAWCFLPPDEDLRASSTA